MPPFRLPAGTRERLSAEAVRLSRVDVAQLTNHTQTYELDNFGAAVARARGLAAKESALYRQGQAEAEQQLRAAVGGLSVSLQAMVPSASSAWQAWAGPIGWTALALQINAAVAAHLRAQLRTFWYSSLPFEIPPRIEAKLRETYGLTNAQASALVSATLTPLLLTFAGPLRQCQEYAESSLDRCREGAFTPFKNIWRTATGGETCLEEGETRGWQCFDRENLADHMALSAIAIAGYTEAVPEMAGAGPTGPTREEAMATEDQNIMRAVNNLLTGPHEQLLREFFSPGNRAGQGWTFGPAWYPPTRATRTYGAMVYGIGVSGALMKNSITPTQVVRQVGGATRPQDAILLGGGQVGSTGYYGNVYRGRADGGWRRIGVARGQNSAFWQSLRAGTPAAAPREDRPRGVGFDPIGAPIQVPVQQGGISVTPASRGLGYALGTTRAGRRGGMVGDQFAPMGLAASQAAIIDESPAAADVSGREDPFVRGDEVYTFPDEQIHVRKPDLGGIIPLIAAALFLR